MSQTTSHVDFTQLVLAIQGTNRVLTSLLAAYQAGIVLDPVPTAYLVANLPATAANGQLAFASNGRKPGEGGGAGTGSLVFFNSGTGTWFTTLNVAVTA